MRLPRVRFTVRRLMLAVGVSALALTPFALSPPEERPQLLISWLTCALMVAIVGGPFVGAHNGSGAQAFGPGVATVEPSRLPPRPITGSGRALTREARPRRMRSTIGRIMSTVAVVGLECGLVAALGRGLGDAPEEFRLIAGMIIFALVNLLGVGLVFWASWLSPLFQARDRVCRTPVRGRRDSNG
jgi:hypothetical protein